MAKLHISDGLKLPVDWITLATVVYGARGSGKTSFGRVAAEEATKARQRFCAIDLKGDWYGLKSSANGKGDGIPVVVFGGEHADVPLEPDAGAFVGETVAKLGQSCILDFELLSKGKQIRFLAQFFEALYHHNREPLLLLLDEAQRYAPQKPGPDEARTLGAVQDLVKLGRKHGIGLVLFTQRGAGLNKEVSELCDMMAAFRTPGPLDQERVRDWLDANTTKAQRDTVMGQLSGLETGTAMFASGHPDLKVFGVYPVRRPETFDSSATPKVGQVRTEPKKLAKPDLDELRTKMAAAIERAKADDPKALRAEIAALKAKANVKPMVMAPATTITVKTPVFNEAEYSDLFEAISTEIDRVAKVASEAKQALGRLLVNYRQLQRAAVKSQPKILPQVDKQQTTSTTPSRPVVSQAASTGLGLPKCDTALLRALVQRHPNTSSRIQISLISGYSVNSSSFNNALSALRSAGLIYGSGDALSPSEAGCKRVGDVPALPTGAQLAEWWRSKLPKAEAALLGALVEARDELSREELAERSGYSLTSSSFNNALSSLRSLQLVERGPIRAHADLID